MAYDRKAAALARKAQSQDEKRNGHWLKLAAGERAVATKAYTAWRETGDSVFLALSQEAEKRANALHAKFLDHV